MSAQKFDIPADLAVRLDRVHPFTAAIVRVGLHVDKRLISTDRAALCVLAAEAHEGRPDVSLGTISKALKRCEATARDAVRRLAWAGYARAEERPSGSIATTWRLAMPSEARWEQPIPRRPKLAEIALPSKSEETSFDDDRHRAIGAKFGFSSELTDQLIELRQNLALPRNRA
nr:hypothetical protein [Methylobacterium sp. ZNC0032]